MDILIFILAVSIGGGLLIASFPAKVKRKDEKHRIVRKLRSKAHQYEWASEVAKDAKIAKTNEIKVLEHMNQWLLDVADEVEEL